MRTISGFPILQKWHYDLYFQWFSQFGAGGGTRTRTTFYGPRILSPVRLPFRHTGISEVCDRYHGKTLQRVQAAGFWLNLHVTR